MNKTLKAILIVSLVLNVVLVVGCLWFRDFVGSKSAEAWSLLADSYAQLSILADLESGDPNRMDALEEKLRASVEMGEKNVAMLRQMFQ